MVSQITIPENYSFVLLSSVMLAIFCHFIGFIMGGGGRKQAFDKEFMTKYFAEEHEKAFGKGSTPDAQGYPDNGDGRYAKKLVYRKWYEYAVR